MKVLILRPQPGAGETAARAETLGLEPVVTPLFTVRPVGWASRDPSAFDSVMLTSANAPRLAGGGMRPYFPLPCYAVGERTGAVAREAGFIDVRTGPSDGAALLRMMAAEGRRSVLHLCGREHRAFRGGDLAVTSIPVYAADSVSELPAAATEAMELGAIVLLHSSRAAEVFSDLVGPARSHIRVAAISAAAAQAARGGWRSIDIAEAPRDQALLELAAKLCQDMRL